MFRVARNLATRAATVYSASRNVTANVAARTLVSLAQTKRSTSVVAKSFQSLNLALYDTKRYFSVDADSDPQFKTQIKQNPAESEEMQDMLRQIKEVVTNNNIVLFMKGTPDAPQCGFSGRVVKILSYLNISYESCNVLDNPLLREGIKIYSDWPTIPQLYVKGEFIGGADIVTSMFTSGELHELLGVPKPAAAVSGTGASADSSASAQ